MDHYIFICANFSKSMFLGMFCSSQICTFLSLIRSSTCQWMVWINNEWQDELQVGVWGCSENDVTMTFLDKPFSFSLDKKKKGVYLAACRLIYCTMMTKKKKKKETLWNSIEVIKRKESEEHIHEKRRRLIRGLGQNLAID